MSSGIRLFKTRATNNSCKNILLSLTLICVCTSPCRAGMGLRTGEEEGLWDEDGYGVVLATIRNIHKNPDAAGYYQFLATLEPRASLCGEIDPSLYPSVAVGFNYDGTGTSVKEMPAEGATVMTVVIRGEKGLGIVSDYCTFMPGSSSLVAVSGLDDPKVKETLKQLQSARKAAAAKAAAATQPAAPASAP